jgi:hypothetical protein
MIEITTKAQFDEVSAGEWLTRAKPPFARWYRLVANEELSGSTGSSRGGSEAKR